MPPSPAMRCSPGRELRADNHKRGRSLESGILSKRKDDDLALFNEVQSRERDNFLLQSNDDFEDTFTNKLRHFSDYKLGINIPARGESSDLLHGEEEKNDYEWLLTPPDTPLFPSLDDEAPEVNLVHRGRPRSQPISISRSSTMEKSHRSSRGSASPNRFSPSPRSSTSMFEGRARGSSAPSSSPPASLRPTSATRRPSPPSHKPTSSVPRVSPPPRRLSTGSSGTTTGARGVSPVKTTRGNSASPKVRAWQSSIPGFSTEVPPNLRTSLADRPASYVRGSSPASRSISSSHSHERDRFSSRSKGSGASSVEDDVESLPSVIIGGSQRLGSRRVGGVSDHKGLVSKKPSRTVSSSSAPKRSFDLALRQMDHRKGPQNMFRPLLSSVPSSSFYVGITSSAHRTMISRNSSVTTSSNASSGLGTSGAHEPEASRDDATSGRVTVQECNVDDEVFVLEKDDGPSHEAHDEPPTTRPGAPLEGPLHRLDDSNLDIDSEKGMLICSKCGCGYAPTTPVENESNDMNVCADCVKLYSCLTFVDPGSESQTVVVDSPEVTGKVKARSGQHDDGQCQGTYGEPIWNFLECAPTVDFSNSKVDSSEGAGISILLKKSSSIKGAVVRNTNFSASSISYDDLSYVRDSTNSVRTASASSSVIENYKFDPNAKHQRSGSSVSGTSSHAFHPSSFGTSIENDENTLRTISSQARLDSGESFEAGSFRKVEDSGTLETCTFEEDVIPRPCVDGSDVPEASVDVILEGDLNCGLKCDELQEARASTDLDKVVLVPIEDLDSSNHESNIIEESLVLVKPEGGRSLTLEEATDTILFCSSIVHKLAYDAATIAINHQNLPGATYDTAPWPLVPATRKTDIDKNELQTQNTTKRLSKFRHRKVVEPYATKPPNSPDTEVKTFQPKTNSSNFESKKPPMLESKCNCTIM